MERVILSRQLEAILGPLIDQEMLISHRLEATKVLAFRDNKLQHRILLFAEQAQILTISQTETHHNLLCK